MTELSIEARYQRTHQAWEDSRKQNNALTNALLSFEEPLPFEVPITMARAHVGCIGRTGKGTHLTATRFYRANPGGGRPVLGFLYFFSAAAIFALTGFTWWFLLAYLLLIPLELHRRRLPSLEPIIFDRETSKIYLYDPDKGHHVGYAFYDAHFYIGDLRGGYNRMRHLYVYLRWQDDEGNWQRTENGLYIAMGSRDRDFALGFWHFLVRYMDKNYQFDEQELEFFEYKKKQLEKLPFKVQGMTYPDGRVEWLN